MQPSASLDVQRDGEIAILRLNRPAKRNALDDDTVRGIERFFGELPGEVRAVVLSARGEHFSAGLDLSSLAHATALESLHRSQMWYRAFERIQFGSVPVIAALHGAVIGGGLELAAATHIRVADATAYYALPEGQRGIFVGGGGSIRISRIIGAHRMMDLMLTGRIYSAEEGQQIGLSQYLVAAGEAESRALAGAAGRDDSAAQRIRHPASAAAQRRSRSGDGSRAGKPDGPRRSGRPGRPRTHRGFSRGQRREDQVIAQR